jgi:hypothetical protein
MNNIEQISNGKTTFKSFCKNNKPLFLITAIVILITYGFKMFNYTPFIDTGDFIDRADTDIYDGLFSVLRYGSWFVKWLFGVLNPEPSSVFIYGAIFLFIATILFAFVFGRYFDQSKKYSSLTNAVFPVLFITSPCLYEIMHFEAQTFEIPLGLIIIALSLLLLSYSIESGKRTRRILFSVAAVALMTFAFSIYQAFVFLQISGIIALFILHCIKNDVKPKDKIIIIIKFIALFVVSYALYNIIGNLLLKITNLPAGTYTTGMMMWGKRPFGENVNVIVSYIKAVVTSKGAVYTWLYPLSSLALFAAGVYRLAKQKRVLEFFAILLLIASPFLLCIALASPPPARGQLALPFVSAFGLYLIVKLIPDTAKKIKILAVSMAAIAVLTYNQATIVNRLVYTDYVVYQQQVMLATQISDRIALLDLGKNPAQPVAFVGNLLPSSNPSMIKGDTTPASHYYWDIFSHVGVTKRVFELWKMLGINNFYPITKDRFEQAQKLAENTPTWPASGSVFVKDDIIIVNLGNSYYDQN